MFHCYCDHVYYHGPYCTTRSSKWSESTCLSIQSTRAVVMPRWAQTRTSIHLHTVTMQYRPYRFTSKDSYIVTVQPFFHKSFQGILTCILGHTHNIIALHKSLTCVSAINPSTGISAIYAFRHIESNFCASCSDASSGVSKEAWYLGQGANCWLEIGPSCSTPHSRQCTSP